MLYFLLFNLFMTIVAVNISNNLFEKHLYKRSKPFGVISKFCFPILFGLLTWGTCYILYLIVYQFINFSFLLISKNKLPIKGQLFAIIPVNNPVFFRVFQKFHQVDIVEQMDFAKTNQIGKCPMPLQPLFDDRQQKIDH